MKRLFLTIVLLALMITGCKPSIEELMKQEKYEEAYMIVKKDGTRKNEFLDNLYQKGKYFELFKCISDDIVLKPKYIERMIDDNRIQECYDQVIKYNNSYENFFVQALIERDKFVHIKCEYDSLGLRLGNMSDSLKKYIFVSDSLSSILKDYIRNSDFKSASKTDTLEMQKMAIEDIGGIFIMTKKSDYSDDYNASEERTSAEASIEGLTCNLIVYNKKKRMAYEIQYINKNNKFASGKVNGLFDQYHATLSDEATSFTNGSRYLGYKYYRALSNYILPEWIEKLKKSIVKELD